jgi:hypothetical protein
MVSIRFPETSLNSLFLSINKSVTQSYDNVILLKKGEMFEFWVVLWSFS